MIPYEAINMFARYFHELDNSFDILSNHEEGRITDLPAYAFGYRHIAIYRLSNTNFYLIKVDVDNTLDGDKGYTGQLNSNEEVRKVTFPFVFNFDLTKIPDDYGVVIENINVKQISNPNAVPVINDSMLAIVREDRFYDTFSIEKAKDKAINTWNNNKKGFDNNYTFIHNLKKIFDRATLIIKKDSFVERRIHRFINTHATYLLPSFKEKYFEHAILFKEEKRVADFVLKRETGFPALLIELESPNQPVFKNNHELTYQAHHAVSQISEWVSFIDLDSRNTVNEMDFMAGPKERLVIIGRGLDNIKEMKNSKFSGTTVWTYEMMLEEAKARWNRLITEQSISIGISEPNLLK